MTIERIEYFKNMTGEQKLELMPSDFLNSELRILFDEMPMRQDCKDIAIMRFIECKTIEQICDRTCFDKKTVKSKLDKILVEFKMTCVKYFFK